LKKLVEEAIEATKADDKKLIIELADILEVIEAITNINEIPIDRLNDIKDQRRKNRGGFQKRLKLLWVEER